ncbi:hypothetical protein HYDPIDRAFT_96099, partial [Hydnomerulius pinastri MD-312]
LGQSYVALSRAATLEGLQVLRFDPKKVMAHSKVIEWNKSLQLLGSGTPQPIDATEGSTISAP